MTLMYISVQDHKKQQAGIAELKAVIKSIDDCILMAQSWCTDQSNNMTEGQICIAAMKDIRRKVGRAQKIVVSIQED